MLAFICLEELVETHNLLHDHFVGILLPPLDNLLAEGARDDGVGVLWLGQLHDIFEVLEGVALFFD